MAYKCPTCGKQEAFDISVYGDRTVDKDGNTLDIDVGHNSDSLMICKSCNHVGEVNDFYIKNEEDE